MLSPGEFAPQAIEAKAPTRSVRLLGMDEVDESTEEGDMPKGVYDRTKGKPKVAEATPPQEATGGGTPQKRVKRRRKAAAKVTRKRVVARAARPRPSVTTARRFGVFDDGSVIVETSDCRGSLKPEEAAALVEFIGRLRGNAA